MIGKLGRRAAESLVLLFAVLGFVFVPLGSRTGLDHARAVLGTREARTAGAELWAAVAGLRARVLGALTDGGGRPAQPPIPAPTGSAGDSALAAPAPQAPAVDPTAGADASLGS